MKVVVINPFSGKGRGKKFYESLIKNKNEFEILYSSKPSEQIDFIKSSKERIEEIWIAGGDGTINLFSNNLNLSEFKIGIVPIGSGNDFARELNIKYDCILKSNFQYVDIYPGLVNIHFNDGRSVERTFLSSLSLGYIAEITKKSYEVKYLKGLPLYLISVLKTLNGRQVLHTKIEINEKHITDKLLMVTIGKTKSAGGGFKLTPGASLLNNLYEVSMAKNVSNLEVLALLPKIILGKHTNDKRFSFDKFSEGSFAFSTPTIVQMDGEIIDGLVNHVEVKKNNNKIKIIV